MANKADLKKFAKQFAPVVPVAKPADKAVAKPSAKPADKAFIVKPINEILKPAAKPAAKPADKPADKPAAKPTAKPADKPAVKPAADAYALHLNNTGRLCFSSQAAARLGEWLDKPVDIDIDEKSRLVRLDIAKKASEDTLSLKDGGGRPYVSITKRIKALGFAAGAGATAYALEAKPYGKSGFEFKLPKMA